jgi:hypothetical protein
MICHEQRKVNHLHNHTPNHSIPKAEKTSGTDSQDLTEPRRAPGAAVLPPNIHRPHARNKDRRAPAVRGSRALSCETGAGKREWHCSRLALNDTHTDAEPFSSGESGGAAFPQTEKDISWDGLRAKCQARCDDVGKIDRYSSFIVHGITTA